MSDHHNGAENGGEPVRDFKFFLDIIDSFKSAGDSSTSDDLIDMKVDHFCDAMTMFLRVFDAFSNPFFSDVVKKDVHGNIAKVRHANLSTGVTLSKQHTLRTLVRGEMADATLLKLIKKESGKGQDSATVALLWMKRTMQFVLGLLDLLVDDKNISLSHASRQSYADSLKHCHNFITRNVFDAGLRFAPTKITFYKNLTGDDDVDKVTQAISQFVVVFKPQVEAIVKFYHDIDLEPFIKA